MCDTHSCFNVISLATRLGNSTGWGNPCGSWLRVSPGTGTGHTYVTRDPHLTRPVYEL
ncbi:hypothetical protein L208DRAFT_502596 [Tricholoma matsutake]|nr:hypothetical protein L208DRAFT_502596 [Tricholoma matsutake 945]